MAKGDGIQRRPGKRGVTYRARVSLGTDPVTGQRRTDSQTFDSYEEARAWRIKRMHEQRAGVYVEPSATLLRHHLAHWLATLDVGAASRVAYESVIRTQINPALGDVPLARLSGQHIQSFLAERRTMASLSRMRAILTAALDLAVSERLLATNPARGLPRRRRPATVDQRARVWTAAQLAHVLSATAAHRYWIAWRLAAYTGLRVGEVVALTWGAIDLERHVLRVERTESMGPDGPLVTAPKSAASRRSVPFDPGTAAALRAHRADQVERRRLAGAAWQWGDWFLDRGDGTRVTSGAVRMAFAAEVRRLGMQPALSFHGLRHTHSSLLLAAGRPLLDVSRRLGHGSISITADTYGHQIPGAEQLDAEAFAALMRSANG